MAALNTETVTKNDNIYSLMIISIATSLVQALIILCLEHCKKGYNFLLIVLLALPHTAQYTTNAHIGLAGTIGCHASLWLKPKLHVSTPWSDLVHTCL